MTPLESPPRAIMSAGNVLVQHGYALCSSGHFIGPSLTIGSCRWHVAAAVPRHNKPRIGLGKRGLNKLFTNGNNGKRAMCYLHSVPMSSGRDHWLSRHNDIQVEYITYTRNTITRLIYRDVLTCLSLFSFLFNHAFFPCPYSVWRNKNKQTD